MIYVASPYSSDDPAVVEQRYLRVREFTDSMIQKGFVAFSPIAYCHPIAQRIGKQTDAATWHRFNMGMLRRAETMYLLCLPGFLQSKGVKAEVQVCKILHIPVIRYDSDFKLMDEAWKDHVPEQF